MLFWCCLQNFVLVQLGGELGCDAGVYFCWHFACCIFRHHDPVVLVFKCAAYIRSLLYFLPFFPRVVGVSYTLSTMNNICRKKMLYIIFSIIVL